MKTTQIIYALLGSVTLLLCNAFSVKVRSSLTRTTATAKSQWMMSSTNKKIIVLGGDGFCGWPTSLYLSDQGHDVVVVDNLSRRKIDVELGCDSLTPIKSIEERCRVWSGLDGGKNIRFKYLDLQLDYLLIFRI